MSSANLKYFVANTKKKAGTNKDGIREQTIDFIYDYFTSKRSWRTIRFLTLPSAWWRFEKSLIERFKDTDHIINITGCEIDWSFYSMGTGTMHLLGGKDKVVEVDRNVGCQLTSCGQASLYNCDIFKYMELSRNSHRMNVIWLDTTATIVSINNKLKYIDRISKKGSIVILTILNGRERKSLPMDRLDYIKSLVEPMGLQLQQEFKYTDSTNMLHLIFIKK